MGGGDEAGCDGGRRNRENWREINLEVMKRGGRRLDKQTGNGGRQNNSRKCKRTSKRKKKENQNKKRNSLRRGNVTPHADKTTIENDEKKDNINKKRDSLRRGKVIPHADKNTIQNGGGHNSMEDTVEYFECQQIKYVNK